MSIFGILLVLLIGSSVIAATASAENSEVLWESCRGGQDDVACGITRGVAAAPAGAPASVAGHIFVADQFPGLAIREFSAWGEFVKMWGWDVVATGPDDKGSDAFEICVPADGDTCQPGDIGAGAGQFSSPQGVAVDSTGSVYVVDRANNRVQKFSSAGEFLRMWGKGVNTGTSGNPNLCTNAGPPTDVCGVGTTGTGNGEFGAWASPASYIAVGPGDKVYVGEVGRIQQFNTSGVWQSSITTGIEATEKVKSLAVGSSGIIYAAIENKDGVRRWSSVGAQLNPPVTVSAPRAIAVDTAEQLYVLSGNSGSVIRKFDPDGAELQSWGQEEPPARFSTPTGIAAGSACLSTGANVYATNPTVDLFVRAYGPVPDQLALCPRPVNAPRITDQYAPAVGITDATVGAEINPRFWDDATYHVEYGTADCAVIQCQKALLPGAPLTSQITNEPVAASATLSGLQPDTTYHFRFVAESSGGGPVAGPDETFTTFPPNPVPVACPNDAFRTGSSALLPDCRAFEMVSPVEKNNGDIRVGQSISNIEALYVQARPDGGKLTYSSGTSFGGAEGAPFVSQYIASRGEGAGWSTQPITPARENNIAGIGQEFLNNQFVAFSEDLCTSWLSWEGDPPLGEGPNPGLEGYRNLYKRNNCTAGAGSYEALTTRTPPSAQMGLCTGPCFEPGLQGFSTDGSHAVYRANDKLAVDQEPEPGAGSNNRLYEVYDGGKVRLVSVLPNGTPSLSTARVGAFLGYVEGNATNAVSEDGSRIFWTAGASGVFVGTLYLRIDGQETLQVSQGSEARFWAARPDGSRALFNEGGDLRSFDVAGAVRTTIATGVSGVVGASEDLSRVYLVSTQVLDADLSTPAVDPDLNSRGAAPVVDGPNIYLYQEGEGFSFIGTLAALEEGAPGTTGLSITSALLPSRLSRVSPGGRHLAFVTRASLTGYDNTDAATGAADTEVFRYAAESDVVQCVSCNPSGARPNGEPEGIFGRGGVAERVRDVAATMPGWQSHFNPKRVLSDDGRRLYFESFDALLPRDTNGKLDVYQWQEPGSGDCSTAHTHYFPQNGGCIALISSGQSAGNSDFIEATPSGNDVFFRTESGLLPQDPGLVDIYDARVGGGFAPPPPPPVPCEGDACQPAAAVPEFPLPGSGSFKGPGDPKPKAANRKRRCPKGKRKVRRAGKTRCVAKKGKKAKQQKRRRANKDRRAKR